MNQKEEILNIISNIYLDGIYVIDIAKKIEDIDTLVRLKKQLFIISKWIIFSASEEKKETESYYDFAKRSEEFKNNDIVLSILNPKRNLADIIKNIN